MKKRLNIIQILLFFIHGFFYYVDKIFEKLFFCIEPIHPFNIVLIIYNIFENIIIVLMIFLYTLFSFYNYYDHSVFTIFNTTGVVTYSIAVILRLNTSFFD